MFTFFCLLWLFYHLHIWLKSSRSYHRVKQLCTILHFMLVICCTSVKSRYDKPLSSATESTDSCGSCKQLKSYGKTKSVRYLDVPDDISGLMCVISRTMWFIMSLRLVMQKVWFNLKKKPSVEKKLFPFLPEILIINVWKDSSSLMIRVDWSCLSAHHDSGLCLYVNSSIEPHWCIWLWNLSDYLQHFQSVTKHRAAEGK